MRRSARPNASARHLTASFALISASEGLAFDCAGSSMMVTVAPSSVTKQIGVPLVGLPAGPESADGLDSSGIGFLHVFLAAVETNIRAKAFRRDICGRHGGNLSPAVGLGKVRWKEGVPMTASIATRMECARRAVVGASEMFAAGCPGETSLARSRFQYLSTESSV
jgi:hypothetical protein